MIEVDARLLAQIIAHGERAYPEEGAGFLLGRGDDPRRVEAILPLPNSREDMSRRNRYLITPRDVLRAEREAANRGLDIVGVFHSHPDHPNLPSEFDREWALPWFSYLITSVLAGKAAGSRCWRLQEDRSSFFEEPLHVDEHDG